MDIASLTLILFAALVNFFEGIAAIIGGLTDSYMPDFVGSVLVSLQVLLLLLAAAFSLINCFSNKAASRLHKFLLLAVSSALFFANLSWLITYFVD